MMIFFVTLHSQIQRNQAYEKNLHNCLTATEYHLNKVSPMIRAAFKTFAEWKF